jgi:hypothetical protein
LKFRGQHPAFVVNIPTSRAESAREMGHPAQGGFREIGDHESEGRNPHSSRKGRG